MTEASRAAEPARERCDLVKADKDIVEGSHRVDQQQLLIERMFEQGHDTVQARTLVLNLKHTLDAWRGHRMLIIKRITTLKAHTNQSGGAVGRWVR
jgi:hypothetical protein